MPSTFEFWYSNLFRISCFEFRILRQSRPRALNEEFHFPKEFAVRRIHIMSKNVRRGMTLIEILVVIAIIAILASLLLVGVMPLLRKGPEVKVRNEISQFAVAMDKFHTKYGTYPPSTLKLCSRRSDYGNAAIDQRSIAIITAMFPQLGGTAAPWVAVNWGNRAEPASQRDNDQLHRHFGRRSMSGVFPGRDSQWRRQNAAWLLD